MSLWKFNTNTSISPIVGANTHSADTYGGQPFAGSDRVHGKRNLIITPQGWVRRRGKFDSVGNYTQKDEIIVAANPGANKTYFSNTYLRYPQIVQVFVSSNSTGGTALQRNALANVYVVFNHAVIFDRASGNGVSTVSSANNGTGYNTGNILRLIGPGAQGGSVTVDTITGNAITTFHVSNSGSGFVMGRDYSTAHRPGSTNGTGAHFVVTGLTKSGTIKLLLSNTAGGNSMRMVSNNVTGNTSLIGANNIVVFKFKPTVAGSYKVAAQTLANSSATALNFNSRNPGSAAANLVITGAVSNTGLCAFTVRSATTGG